MYKDNNDYYLIHGTEPFSLYFNKVNENINKNIENEHEYKENLEFLEKFKGRIETIGRKGMKDIINKTNIPINNPPKIPEEMYYRYQYNNPNTLPKIQSFSENNIKTKSKYLNYYNKSRQNPLDTLIYNPKINSTVIYARPNVIKIGIKKKKKKKKKNLSINNNYEEYNQERERSYIPYSIEDYQRIMNNFQKNKFNGLGYDYNNKDWKNREEKLLKRNNYSNLIEKNKLGINNKFKLKNPKEMEREKLEEKNLNSIRFKTNQYGNYITNKFLDEINRRRYEEELMLKNKEKNKNSLYKKYYNKLINQNQNEYKNNLLKLKESLI